MCWVAVTVFSLATSSVFISQSNRVFLPAYLPAFHSVRAVFSDTVLFGSSSKLSFRLGVLKHFSASVNVRRGSCMVLPGLRRFCVWFISGNAIQPFCSFYYELGAFLSLFVYMANVCNCKVCVCVLWFYWKSISFFYVLLTVHLSIILITDQLNAQTLFL